MSRPKKHSADVALSALLDALAPMLIALDVTPAIIEQLSRASFVRAGALRARMKSSGRPHLARIAAMTGLSRSEVKRLVATNCRVDTQDPETLPRALRVLHGWRTSTDYIQRGRPKKLRIGGKAPSFCALCKSRSGDIPYKVILNELERRKLVKVDRQEKSVTALITYKNPPQTSRDLAALVFASLFLQEAVKSESVLLRRREKVASSGDLADAYIAKAVTGRIDDVLNQFPEQFVRKGARRSNLLNVFTLVTKISKQS